MDVEGTLPYLHSKGNVLVIHINLHFPNPRQPNSFWLFITMSEQTAVHQKTDFPSSHFALICQQRSLITTAAF